jgi:hypothetical protein
VCLNETLYYKSPTGICAYEGGLPVNISAPLGNRYYTRAVAGAYMNKYYICMTDVNNRRNLFCFDAEKGIWHKEDNIDIVAFANNNCNLYFVEKTSSEYRLGVIDGENMYGNFMAELSGFTLEDDFEWYALTGIWGLNIPVNKYYGNFLVRATGDKGSLLSLSYDTDSENEYRELITRDIRKTGSFLVPLTIPRCDHIRLMLRGKGKVKIYSIMRKIETGSDIFV